MQSAHHVLQENGLSHTVYETKGLFTDTNQWLPVSDWVRLRVRVSPISRLLLLAVHSNTSTIFSKEW